MGQVLVASEDYRILSVLEALFSGNGHVVRLATTGLEAYESVLADSPDLVILEPVLAIHDGFTTCQLMRGDPDVPAKLPIVFLVDEKIDARQLESCGATAQFYKHWDNAQLYEQAVAYLAEGAGVTRQADSTNSVTSH